MHCPELALVLVDVQRDFWRPLANLQPFASFPENMRRLLTAARAHGLTVLHTQAFFAPSRSDWMLFYRPNGRGQIPCVSGTGGEVIEDFAAPKDGEPIIRKQTFDGFIGTNLEQSLRERKIKAILVAGLVTSVCVLFTATAAYVRRFVPIVVTDACADSPESHDAALRIYDGLCFQSVTTAQVERDLPSVLRLAERFTPAP